MVKKAVGKQLTKGQQEWMDKSYYRIPSRKIEHRPDGSTLITDKPRLLEIDRIEVTIEDCWHCERRGWNWLPEYYTDRRTQKQVCTAVRKTPCIVCNQARKIKMKVEVFRR